MTLSNVRELRWICQWPVIHGDNYINRCIQDSYILTSKHIKSREEYRWNTFADGHRNHQVSNVKMLFLFVVQAGLPLALIMAPLYKAFEKPRYSPSYRIIAYLFVSV